MEWPEDLLELFDDPLLADVRPKPAAITADDRRVKTLLKITEWVEQNGRKPERSGNLNEKLMWKSLEALRAEGSVALKEYDRLGILEI